MKTLGKYVFSFPESDEEVRAWNPYIRIKALHCGVLCVATLRIEGTWKAYCASVPGMNHNEEWRDVLNNGDEIEEGIARAVFPIFEGIPYAR
jgi:hypothetical protein